MDASAVIIFGSAILSLAGMFLVRRFFPPQKLERLHDAAGNMLAVVGTMYALLVALIVVDAMTNMQEARSTTEMEANSLADIFRLADGFEEKERLSIQRQTYQYGKAVVEDEWKTMTMASESEQAWREFNALWKTVQSVEPKSEREQAFYSQIISELSSMGDNRRSRLLASQHGISPLLWWVLVTGAGVTICFTYLFAVESWRLQAIMITLVSTTIALNLFLIDEYGYPFTGSLCVSPDAFTEDLVRFSRALGIDSNYKSNRIKGGLH